MVRNYLHLDRSNPFHHLSCHSRQKIFPSRMDFLRKPCVWNSSIYILTTFMINSTHCFIDQVFYMILKQDEHLLLLCLRCLHSLRGKLLNPSLESKLTLWQGFHRIQSSLAPIQGVEAMSTPMKAANFSISEKSPSPQFKLVFCSAHSASHVENLRRNLYTTVQLVGLLIFLTWLVEIQLMALSWK